MLYFSKGFVVDSCFLSPLPSASCSGSSFPPPPGFGVRVGSVRGVGGRWLQAVHPPADHPGQPQGPAVLPGEWARDQPLTPPLQGLSQIAPSVLPHGPQPSPYWPKSSPFAQHPTPPASPPISVKYPLQVSKRGPGPHLTRKWRKPRDLFFSFFSSTQKKSAHLTSQSSAVGSSPLNAAAITSVTYTPLFYLAHVIEWIFI